MMNKFLQKLKPFIDKIKKYSDIITPTAVLAIICIVVTLALSSTNLLTAGKIEKLAVETQNKAMEKVLKGEYKEITETINGDKVTYHLVKKDDQKIGYIFITTANGYGGEISVMTAVDMDKKVIAVEILAAADETPGLGQNVTKPEWYAQFSELTNDITVVKDGSANKESNNINAVTGATISSKAVTSAVNQALDYAEKIIAKGDELK